MVPVLLGAAVVGCHNPPAPSDGASPHAAPGAAGSNMSNTPARPTTGPAAGASAAPSPTPAVAEADEAKAVEIEATNFKFSPEKLDATPGQKLKVTLVNKGTSSHGIAFKLPAGAKEIEKFVQPGQSGTMDVTAPDKEGEYTYYCPVGSHEDKGMTGKLVVKAK